MRYTLRAIAFVSALLLLPALTTAPATAQETPEAPTAPQPTAEHESLGMWVGTWKGSGTMEAGPFGPGGPVEWSEECSWLGDTKFHVVCRTRGTTPMGPTVGFGVMGYDAEREVFTHYGVDSTGWAGLSEGTREGDTWTYASEETFEGQTYRSRFSLTVLSPKNIEFRWEMSEDGESWTTVMDGTSEKQ